MIKGIRWLKYFLIGFGLILILGLIFHRPLLRNLAKIVVYEKSDFDRVDAVAVLSGVIPTRAFQAAQLLRDQKADVAILFREALPDRYRRLRDLGVAHVEDHEINRGVLTRLGVDDKRILTLPETVDSTWEEALAFRRLVTGVTEDTENTGVTETNGSTRKGFRAVPRNSVSSVTSVAIVTCRYHSYRAYLNFTTALEGTGVEVYSVPSSYCSFDPQDWWEDRDEVRRLYNELANLAVFFVGKR